MLTIATPLVFGALGAILNERAGVLNLGIEGTMYAGAFVGFLGRRAERLAVGRRRRGARRGRRSPAR